MDLELLIWLSQDRVNLVEGAIVECRQPKYCTWDAENSEYVPDQGTCYTPNCVIIYITGCPVASLDDVKHLLEEKPDQDTYSEIRWWSAKRNALHPVDEGAPLISRLYLTLTWERFKEVVENIDGFPITDDMLGSAYWEAKV